MHTNSAPNLQRIRVTLDLEVDGNSFNPHQIDYHSLFDINEEYEKLTVTIEDLSVDVDTLWEYSYEDSINNWNTQFFILSWQISSLMLSSEMTVFRVSLISARAAMRLFKKAHNPNLQKSAFDI